MVVSDGMGKGKKAAAEIHSLGLTLDEYCAIFLANPGSGVPSLTSDTPDTLSLAQGSSYTFAFQPSGALAVPTFTTGDGTILSTAGLRFRVSALGAGAGPGKHQPLCDL